ncbi:retrovirus-related Pol polyprotein from transposon 17.6 [Trichonephila clavipes]|nr:retrovirus-related Pol polyprotein from transposon 17.6 [Trichonephila clavipes]
MYKNALKEDLIRVVEDLDGTVESTDTIVKLKTKIENSSTFESDPDFVKNLIQNCIDERVSRNEREVTFEKQKIELAKLQLATLEKEVELQTVKNKALSLNPAAKIEEKPFETLNKETATHIGIREAEDWFRPIDLAKECDIYISSRSGSHKEIPITYGYTQDPFKNRSQNFKPKIKENYPQYLERENKNCYICGDSSHYARDCEKRFKPKESNDHIHNRINVNTLKVESEKQNSDEFANLQYVHIFVENQPVTALIDSGCQIPVLNSSLIRVQTPSEEIITLSSCFGEQRMVEVKPINLSLNQHSPSLSVRTAISPTLTEEFIIHPSVYAEIKKLGHAKSDVLLSESGSSLSADSGVSFPNVSVSNVIENSSYDLPHVKNFNTRNDLSSLIKNYKPNKIKSPKLKMCIILKDDIPVCQRARRLSCSEKLQVDDQIDDWLQQGIIKESVSDYCSPIVLCKKKDGNLRLCIDSRKINSKTEKDRYPLPLIEEVLDQLQSGNFFSTIDLKNGFFHVEMEENSKKFTSFVTHNGQYEFNKVPFGLCNSPSVFQRFINHVFRDLLKEGIVIIYMDDIIIPSSDELDGLNRHIIERGTIKPSLDKTKAVQNFPEPKNVKQVQSFLGLSGYFRKFIQNYSIIAKPLSDLLRDNAVFHFGPEQQLAFQTLRQKLSENPVLHIFKQGAKLELHTDASKFGYGAILLQQSDDNKLHPVHYFSKKTTPQEEKYSSYELEVLAVIESLKKFRNNLVGNKFKIVTDCSAFQKTMSKKQLTPKIARWALFFRRL